MMEEVAENIKSTGSHLILLMVGALAEPGSSAASFQRWFITDYRYLTLPSFLPHV